MVLAVIGTVMGALLAPSCNGDEPSSRPPRTWVVPDGQTRTFGPDEVQSDDVFRCSDNGAGIEGVPPRGEGAGNSTGIFVDTDTDGSVTVRCEAGPPGNE